MKFEITAKVPVLLALSASLIFNACAPLKEFGKTPVYEEANSFAYPIPGYDSSKKTVVVVANNDGTELFDMMAPYYLFSTTGRANVYLVAKNKYPIVVKKGLFVLPQSTFSEIDSLGIKPDVIVIPYLSAADSIHQDPVIVNWIKQHYSNEVNILAVCDGAATAAATGIFDSKPMTAHASDYAGIKPHFSKPLWRQNISVANEKNLYSTAGVSNAAEGSLMVINKLFGKEVMQKVIDDIKYPNPFPKTEHQSNTFHFGDKAATSKKILFRKNKRIGVLLQEGMNEFELASILDTYNRTFPKSIESFSYNDSAIKTKYGLTIIPTGRIRNSKLDELHIATSVSFPAPGNTVFNSAEIVKYDDTQKQYLIDKCLSRIRLEYGSKFENVVKLMLDYN
jgi:transcriptional regulator GlxA family with amidase domain